MSPAAVRHLELGRLVAVGGLDRADFTYSVIEPAPQFRRGERRGEARTRSHLREAHVAERLGKLVVECRIRDLSRRGARLQLDKDRPLPKTFLLSEPGTKRCYWATLAWQVGRDAGVRLKPVD